MLRAGDLDGGVIRRSIRAGHRSEPAQPIETDGDHHPPASLARASSPAPCLSWSRRDDVCETRSRQRRPLVACPDDVVRPPAEVALSLGSSLISSVTALRA